VVWALIWKIDVSEGTIDLPASFNNFGDTILGPVAFTGLIFNNSS
jgi:hypothetical protein